MTEYVAIHLDGVGLADEIYETYDLSTLEDQLIPTLGTKGELDGHEFRDKECVIYLSGGDGDEIFETIKPVLMKYPLCENARVLISGRHGQRDELIQVR